MTVAPCVRLSAITPGSVSGWASYDEYGNTTTADAVDGTLGYGWLGTKQRATSTARSRHSFGARSRWVDDFEARFKAKESALAVYNINPTAAFQLHERFRWPADEVLLLSCGVVASPQATSGNTTSTGSG